MSRLPSPGSDDNAWGDILNDYLAVTHNSDGTIKSAAVLKSMLESSVQVSLGKADTALQSAVDATTTSKGFIQLAGDLAGTAAAPTVPGLADIQSGRLGATSQDVSGGDLNNLKTTGFYKGSNMSNTPNGNSGWQWIIVERHDDGWTSQKAIGYAGSIDETTWTRIQYNGSWRSWRQLAFNDSPGLSGTPTAPTAGSGTNNSQIATTAFANTAASNAANGVYSSYDNGRLDSRTNSLANTQIDNRGIYVQATGAVANCVTGNSYSVTFPSGRFPSGSSPVVVCSGNSSISNNIVQATPFNITSTGCSIAFYRYNATATTVNWWAALTR